MRTRSGHTREIFNNTHLSTSHKNQFDFLKKKRQKDSNEVTKINKQINQNKVNIEKNTIVNITKGSKMKKSKKSPSLNKPEKEQNTFLELIRNNSNQEVFNDNFVDSLMVRPDKESPGTGLKNLGNTCFLNSVLQCILYTIPLKNYFAVSNHSETCKSKNVCFICEYGRLSNQIRKFNFILGEKKSAVTPQNIIHNIKNIANHIRIGRQEDAHEFLLYFLAAMENSATNYVISIDKKYNKLKKGQISFLEDNLIQKIFGGALSSSVTCQRCKNSSSRVDRFLDISLVRKKN
jgi:uncharacterized UBP type Zn finger protein